MKYQGGKSAYMLFGCLSLVSMFFAHRRDMGCGEWLGTHIVSWPRLTGYRCDAMELRVPGEPVQPSVALYLDPGQRAGLGRGEVQSSGQGVIFISGSC